MDKGGISAFVSLDYFVLVGLSGQVSLGFRVFNIVAHLLLTGINEKIRGLIEHAKHKTSYR